MGLFAKFKEAWLKPMSFDSLNEGFYDDLEEALILADVGMDTAVDAVAQLKKRAYAKLLTHEEDVKNALRDILTEKLSVGDPALDLSTRPSVALIIGVNGVGKTTSIGKLAHRLKNEGKKVLLCAGDTFRAAAADQLEIWAERAGVDIVRQNEGADPGAVLFDSLAAAKARNTDVVLCDTAGRLHNKDNLMKELAKLRKIIDREAPNAAKETLLVLDATTGQNGLIQARQFKETAGLTGIILTKLDGTAKGGIVIAIAQELQVPVKFVGLGEGIDDLRPFDEITTGFIKFAEGSVLIRCGDTVVLCNASVEERVPPHVAPGCGWVTAEYSMLPRANRQRSRRDIDKLKLSGRSAEIQRLIGRSLRAAVDRRLLGERTITVDCDVLQGDGGTRTASVTGGFIALALACRKLVEEGVLPRTPVKHFVAGISAGIIDDAPMLDLPYSEDSRAMVDLNCVMNGLGEIIELQGTGEGRAFTAAEQQELVELCAKGCRELIRKEKDILGEVL